MNVMDFRATLIRMNRVSISNLSKKGDVPIHLAIMATLMGEMAEHQIHFRKTLVTITIEPKKLRLLGQGRFGSNRQRNMFIAQPGQRMAKRTGQ